MSNSPSNATLLRTLVLAGLLLAVLLLPSRFSHPAYAQETIEYAENGQGAVAAYTAIDPDEDTEITWTLSGNDDDDFTIDGGVLEFVAVPDYESPTDTGTDNTYNVTVQASDGTASDTTDVIVMVTNVDEDGVVTLSAVQPREATLLTATHTDPDGSIANLTWQWYRSSSANGPWTEEIEDATTTAYTPGADDVGKYLRATASYDDGEDTGKTAHGVSDNTVLADTSNKAPVFQDDEGVAIADGTGVGREIAENSAMGTAVGDPVAATDANGDTLTYTLGGTDASSFTIDRGTGQIRVGTASPDYEDSSNNAYEVTVTAKDPSDTDTTQFRDTITVTITVTDVDEDPEMADPTADAGLTSTDYNESTEATENIAAVSTYSATDDDDDNASPAKVLTWSLAGTDRDQFAIGNGGGAPDFTRGELRFKSPPDFEAPTDSGRNNVYNVTVVVTDSGGKTDTRDVTVTVDNVEEAGTVVLSTLYPEVDARLEATLTDPDGRISNLTWEWQRGTTTIVGATSRTYTPEAGDATNNLTAIASYTDGEGTGKTAEDESDNAVVAVTAGNTPPAFTDGATATREVAENTEAGQTIGTAVSAADSQGRLTYSLGGTNRDSFTIDRTNGQLSTKAALDYEKKSRYTVTVKATDSSLASDTITVTINVTDVDEPPTPTGGETEIDYAEMGTAAVDTYTATDPEDDRASPRKPLTWSLSSRSGTDADGFSISQSGVLTFDSPPDYEDPEDSGTNNTYEVTVTATDSGDSTRAVTSATWEVTVTVSNVDESGTVTLSSLQPQQATELTASLTDPDGASNATPPVTVTALTSDVTWQWYRSSSANGPWTEEIEDATTTAYTPGADDVGRYLRATATYKDGHSGSDGDDKTAHGISANAVRADTSNKAPVFQDDEGEEITTTDRDIAENSATGTAVGAPVSATDPNNDTLTYTLGGTDAGSFTIDRGTGQIRVGAGTTLDVETDSSYTVTVTAADPSGLNDEITVTITVTNLDEKPEFTAGDTAISHAENTDTATAVATYTATDPEANTPEWALSGYDADDFTISTAGALTFVNQPNYEAPTDSDRNNRYQVTVEAADSAGNTATRDVTVTVTDVEEDGVVKLSTLQPMVGIALTASLTDPDGNISGVTWQWARSTSRTGSYVEIPGATLATFTPTGVGDFLQATATYSDGYGSTSAFGRSANAVLAAAQGNVAPTFPDQEPSTPGIQNTMATRSIPEDASPGDSVVDALATATTDDDPVSATDGNAGENLTYSLNGLDVGTFEFTEANRATGQITLRQGVKLDYETKKIYTVTVTATDPSLESATITVTINVTDVNETPEIVKKALVITGRRIVDYPEGDDRPVATYTAAGPNASNARWTLRGDDSSRFAISSQGELTFRSPPDFEQPIDMGMDNEYRLTVHATDGQNTHELDVAVRVGNVDEDGEVTLSDTRPQIGTVITATLTDPDGVTMDSTTWRWESSGTADGPWSTISGETSETYTPVAADQDSYLRVTAYYSDTEGSGKSAEAVTDAGVGVDDDGVVALSPEQPEVDAEITATLTDPDGGVTGEAWQWARSANADGPWTDIAGATSAAYTPVDADLNSYLRATVTYDDADGAGKSAEAVSANATAPENDGVVALSSQQPEADAELTATLTDPDGGVTGATWQWATSSAATGPWSDITGATSAAYTPVDADVGSYLRATVSYTDAQGPNKSAEAVSANAVRAARANYDFDGDGTISPSEVLQAVRDYFAGLITASEVLAVVRLYFSG